MKKLILFLLVLIGFVNCKKDKNEPKFDSNDSRSFLDNQASLYSCCYSSQRENLPSPLNECETPIDSASYDDIMYLGFFEPLESTFMALPSMEEERDFIFINQHGEQITLNYDHRNIRIGNNNVDSYSFSGTVTLLCKESLIYDILVTSESLDYKMHISISTKVTHQNDTNYLNDYLVLRRSDSLGVFRTWPGYYILSIDKRNSSDEHLYSANNTHHEEIVLNDILFHNVYTDTPSYYNGDTPLNTYYFSYDYGLVGIKDEFDNLWVLNKIE